MFVTVCDKCKKILDNKTDSVEIEYNYKKQHSVLGKVKKVHLCASCYKEIFGNQLEELQNNEDIKW